jgi:DmsE family decaheme c-type cytochrome
MKADEPITRPPSDAVPGQRPTLRTRRLWMLCAPVLAGAAIMFGANGTERARGQSSLTAPAYTAEARTCTPCHSEVVKSFADNPHAGSVATRDGKGVTCASCHGSQKAHVETGGVKSKALDPALGTFRQADDMCLSCHGGKPSLFQRSAHGKSNVSCVDCHRIHSPGKTKYLVKVAQKELCLQCHADVKPQFWMPFHHKVEEGLVECTDCHDPHGALQERSSASSHGQNSYCTNCHLGTAGPFAFEHAVVKTEGCTACHVPHGGPNPHLLVRADVDAVCRQCHLPPPDPKTGAHMQPASGHAEDSRPCTACHADVHGSNSSPVFQRER